MNYGNIVQSVANCEILGEGTGGNSLGGFIGSNFSVINDCYSTGTINANSYASSKINYLGGVDDDAQVAFFVGSNGLNETDNIVCMPFMMNCYYDTNKNPKFSAIYAGDNHGVIGKSSVEMKSNSFIQLLNNNDDENMDIWTQSSTNKLPTFLVRNVMKYI